MSDERETPAELSPAEAEIMEIVWDRGEVSASDVRGILASTRDLARNTVRTLLERMEAKGWVGHRAEGRTYVYSAVRPRRDVVGRKVREVVDTVCGGSPETLVAALLDYRGLSEDELERIRRLLATARADRDKEESR